MKRIALLCAVVLLFAAPSWAAGGFTVSVNEDSTRFEDSFTITLGEGNSFPLLPKMVATGVAENGETASIAILEFLGETFVGRVHPNGERTVEVLIGSELDCGVYRIPGLPDMSGLVTVYQEKQRLLHERLATLGYVEMVNIPPPPTTIDILYAYEESAIAQAGSEAMLLAEMQIATQTINEMAENSGMEWLSFRAVGFENIREEIPYTSSAEWWPGSHVNIRLARDYFGADVVFFVAGDWHLGGEASFFCGQADCAYSVLVRQALLSMTPAHEMGHLLGLDHDPPYAQGNGFGLPEFNKSMHVCVGPGNINNRSGVMSYSSGPECGGYAARFNRISGRDEYYLGIPFWISGLSEQVQVVEMFAGEVAAFRYGNSGPCEPNEATYCLDSGPDDNRFEVTVTYASALGGGISGVGRKVEGITGQWDSSQTALFYFIAPSNLEVTVKIINACGFTEAPRFWVFLSDMTDIAYTVEIRDTASNVVRTYSKQDGQFPFAEKDFYAFTCP